MMRVLPAWVGALHDDLDKILKDLAFEYGIPYELADDSEILKHAKSSIVGRFETISDFCEGRKSPILAINDKEFGWKRKEAEEEYQKRQEEFKKANMAKYPDYKKQVEKEEKGRIKFPTSFGFISIKKKGKKE